MGIKRSCSTCKHGKISGWRGSYGTGGYSISRYISCYYYPETIFINEELYQYEEVDCNKVDLDNIKNHTSEHFCSKWSDCKD